VGKLCFGCCIIVLYPWVGKYETEESRLVIMVVSSKLLHCQTGFG